jgi:hypothetical protein
MHRFVLRCVAVSLGLLTMWACGLTGADVRFGGIVGATGAVWPIPGADVSFDAFVGLGGVEAASRTEFSLFPYTVGSETLSVSLTREWLSLSGGYQFSLVPIGITSAEILARARPSPWQFVAGGLLLDVSIEGEARLKGEAFSSTPLRTEIWTRGTAGVSRSVGCVDPVRLAISLETTVSAPGGGGIWPTPALLASASIGNVTLAGEARLTFAGGLHLDSGTVTLSGAWRDVGLSAAAWCTFSGEPRGASLGIRAAYEFGDSSLAGSSANDACAGGVCR